MTDAEREEDRLLLKRIGVKNDTPIAFRLLLDLLISNGVICREEWFRRLDAEVSRQQSQEKEVRDIMERFRGSRTVREQPYPYVVNDSP